MHMGSAVSGCKWVESLERIDGAVMVERNQPSRRCCVAAMNGDSQRRKQWSDSIL
jgi:hypothetical protein